MSVGSFLHLPFPVTYRSGGQMPISTTPISPTPKVVAIDAPVSGSSMSLSHHVQGSALIGWIVMLFALLLLATPPLAVLALAREKPAPTAPVMPVKDTRFA